jgi:hypothetical protein
MLVKSMLVLPLKLQSNRLIMYTPMLFFEVCVFSIAMCMPSVVLMCSDREQRKVWERKTAEKVWEAATLQDWPPFCETRVSKSPARRPNLFEARTDEDHTSFTNGQVQEQATESS